MSDGRALKQIQNRNIAIVMDCGLHRVGIDIRVIDSMVLRSTGKRQEIL